MYIYMYMFTFGSRGVIHILYTCPCDPRLQFVSICKGKESARFVILQIVFII